MLASAIASQSYGVCASCHAKNMNMGVEALWASIARTMRRP